LSKFEHFGKEMMTVVGVKKIQLFECVSTSFGFLAKLRNHPRNGRQRENPTFFEAIENNMQDFQERGPPVYRGKSRSPPEAD
jgi:hypothetical protein